MLAVGAGLIFSARAFMYVMRRGLCPFIRVVVTWRSYFHIYSGKRRSASLVGIISIAAVAEIVRDIAVNQAGRRTCSLIFGRVRCERQNNALGSYLVSASHI